MHMLRQLYVIGSTLITVVSALLKMSLGGSMMAASAWFAVQSDFDTTLTVIAAMFFIWGFVIFVRALGQG